MSYPVCVKCGSSFKDLPEGIYFGRANEKGVVPAIWECKPGCNQPSKDHAVIAAINEEGRGK